MLLLKALLVLAVLAECSCAGYRRVCYYTNWAQYRNGKGQFFPENVEPTLCTHVIYAFAKPDGIGIAAYEWNDESTSWSKGMYERMMDLKKSNPGLKVILAIGGYNMGTTPFLPIVATSASRSEFADKVVSFLRKRNFDGLDMDWEYPGARGGSPADKNNLVLAMQELAQKFQTESVTTGNQRLLLTGAFPAGKKTIDDGYDLPALAAVMDFISIMTYDFNGSWNKSTGMNSPLFAHTSEVGAQRNLNLHWVAEYYVALGVPKDKLNIGIATYGRSFTLNNPSQHGVGAPANQAGQAGQYTRENGFIAYYEICDMINNGAQVVDVPSQRVRYIHQDTQWVGYDDVQSVTEKACYTKQNGYGGVMFWALDLDDFKDSSCYQGKYPLMTAVKQELEQPSLSNCASIPGSNPAGVPQTYRPVINAGSTVAPPMTRPPYSFTLPTSGGAFPQNPFPAITAKTTQRPFTPVGGITSNNNNNNNNNNNINNNPYMFTLPTYTGNATPQPPLVTFVTRQPTSLPVQTPAPFQPSPSSGPAQSPTGYIPFNTAAPTNPPVNTGGTTPSLTQTSSFDCTARDNDFYADPTSCDHFYICAKQVAYKVRCAYGLRFNTQVKHCDWSYNVVCQKQPQQPAPTSAPSPVQTNMPVQTPLVPQTYRPVNLQSLPTTKTPGIQQGTNQCPLGKNSLRAHVTDCNKFIQCSFGMQFEMVCPNALVFNSRIGACDYLDNVPQCAGRSGTKLQEICSSVFDGDTLHAHPTDCHKFIQCMYGFPYVFTCPASLVFNPRKSACDYENSVPECTGP